MPHTSILPLVIFLSLVLNPWIVGHAFGEVHVVTATGEKWHYRQYSSTVGTPRQESQPVTIEAEPGDLIEFRQTNGRHGVFFYVTPRKDSELGRGVRRTDVTKNFLVMKGLLEPERLSNRDFLHENVTTGSRNERGHLLSIRLKKEFNRPVYFGCRVHSAEESRDAMWGVIQPKSARAQLSAPFVLTQTELRRFLPKSLQGYDPEWPQQHVLRGNNNWTLKQLILDHSGANQSLPAFDKWSCGYVVDLNQDRVNDIVGAIRDENDRVKWRAFKTKLPSQGDLTRTTVASFQQVPLTKSPEGLESHFAPENAFARSADLSADDHADLIISPGKSAQLFVFKYRSLPSRYKRSDVLIELSYLRQFSLNQLQIASERQNVIVDGLSSVSGLAFVNFTDPSDGWLDIIAWDNTTMKAAMILNSPKKVLGGKQQLIDFPAAVFPITGVSALALPNRDGGGHLSLIVQSGETLSLFQYDANSRAFRRVSILRGDE